MRSTRWSWRLTRPRRERSETMADNEERELKLLPVDPGLLDALAQVARLGPFAVTGRRTEVQQNGIFDTPDRDLAVARVGFRRRTIVGEPLAIWTAKGPAARARGEIGRASCRERVY